MLKYRSSTVLFAGLICIQALFSGCSNESKDEEPFTPSGIESLSNIDKTLGAKNCLHNEIITTYYYWYKDVAVQNSNIDVTKFDIYKLFDLLLYKNDRWSWMSSAKEYLQDEAGIVPGWGVSIGQAIKYYNDYAVRIRYVYPGSPFGRQGVKRGWVLTHIGDDAVSTLIRNDQFYTAYEQSPQTFTFKDTDGNTNTFTASRESVQTRSYLKQTIFTSDNVEGLQEPVGYFHYLSFNSNFSDDIIASMQDFHAAGVKKLILDLRYNPGGDTDMLELLIDYLAPSDAEGQVYMAKRHNAKLSSWDESYQIDREEQALDLDRLYVITGKGCASASEALINGLRPLMDVQIVGETTYGKPNGMYVLLYPGSDKDYDRYERDDFSHLEFVFLPICFYHQNKLGEQCPDDGFTPTNNRPDDLYHDFDNSEDLINACLTHIITGEYPELPALAKSRTKVTGTEITITEEQHQANYGKMTERMRR